MRPELSEMQRCLDTAALAETQEAFRAAIRPIEAHLWHAIRASFDAEAAEAKAAHQRDVAKRAKRLRDACDLTTNPSQREVEFSLEARVGMPQEAL